MFRFIEGEAWTWARRYGYGEIETPIFEFSDVFHRSLGEASDVVHKETYTFTDRGGESITLRPEGTAGVARAFVSEGMAQSLPLRFYYSGPMFRYERPQKGRYRQFYQLGIESLGLETPKADVEVLSMAWDFLGALGLQSETSLEINTLGDAESRRAYREKLVEYFTGFRDKLSADSQMRLEKNPLRILDSKDEGDRALIAGAPRLQDCLNEASASFFKGVCAGLEALGIRYNVNDRLVRGLDYYCHTVFEFTTDRLGAQGTVLAGGRYDGLIELMGGQKTPGVGWAAGIDRLADLVTGSALVPAVLPLVCVAPLDDGGELEALKVANELRADGHRAEIIWSGNMGKKMKKANTLGAAAVLIVGGDELARGEVGYKNFATGEQKNVARAAVVASLRELKK